MKEHVLFTLAARSILEISRATSFDLNPTACFRLYMLHISAAGANDLGTDVEARE